MRRTPALHLPRQPSSFSNLLSTLRSLFLIRAHSVVVASSLCAHSTHGHPLFDFPLERRTFDYVSMELSSADAARYRSRSMSSTAWRLAALATAGSCKPSRGSLRSVPRARGGSRLVASSAMHVTSPVPSPNASARLTTLRPTHLIGIRDLADCLRCCAAWQGCRYVTFTPRGGTECSLYSACDLQRLSRQAKTLSLELTPASSSILDRAGRDAWTADLT